MVKNSEWWAGWADYCQPVTLMSHDNRIPTLSQVDVSDRTVNVLLRGEARVDHEPIHKLHRLGSLSSKLSGHDHLTTLRPTLHDKAEHSIASTVA